MTTAKDPEGFTTFWEGYPRRRRGKRKRAVAAWQRAVKGGATAEQILAGLAAWNASWDWRKDNGEFSPEPHRWLNDEAWLTPPGPRFTGAKSAAATAVGSSFDAIAAWGEED